MIPHHLFQPHLLHPHLLPCVNAYDQQEETNFGQSRFGHPDLTNLGQSNFGQSISGSGVCHGGALEGGPRTGEVGRLQGKGPNPEKVGTPKGGGPKGGAPKGGGPKISRFFFPLPLPFSLFLSLLGLLVELWWCLKRWGHQMCLFGVLGLSCEAPAARLVRGTRLARPRTGTRPTRTTRSSSTRHCLSRIDLHTTTDNRTKKHNKNYF